MNFVLLVVVFSLLTAGYANALCVSAQKANLRSGPGTNYGIAWEIYKYMPVAKVGVSLSGEWHSVSDVDGDVSWIYKSMVTEKCKCAVVDKNEVNIKTGGTDYSKSPISPSKKYYFFRVLKKKGQ